MEPSAPPASGAGSCPNVGPGVCYKYHVSSRHMGYKVDKADPFAFTCEVPPKSASVTWDLAYDWDDADWMASREAEVRPQRPGVDLRGPPRLLGADVGAAVPLARLPRARPRGWPTTATKMGFTHVEFLPLTEHPFFGVVGLPGDRVLRPDQPVRHPAGPDVPDRPPAPAGRSASSSTGCRRHFATDEHGLGYFDGTHLYEHGDPRQGFHPDWGSFVFNYGRHEVRSFLLSSAPVLAGQVPHRRAAGRCRRVDAVPGLLAQGRRVDPEPTTAATRTWRRSSSSAGSTTEVYKHYPDVQTIAEESTAWPMVCRPTYVGGLGFGYKWDMGWMHDTLKYSRRDPVHRKFHHHELTFRMLYAFTRELRPAAVARRGGPRQGVAVGQDARRRVAEVRQPAAAVRVPVGDEPGKKLLFMGGEFGQRSEWRHDASLDWHLLEYDPHRGRAAAGART